MITSLLPRFFMNHSVHWSRASVCLSVCLSVRRRMPTLLHGPGCNSGEWYGLPLSCALLGEFASGARVSLLWQHSVERKMSASNCTRSMPVQCSRPIPTIYRHITHRRLSFSAASLKF